MKHLAELVAFGAFCIAALHMIGVVMPKGYEAALILLGFSIFISIMQCLAFWETRTNIRKQMEEENDERP